MASHEVIQKHLPSGIPCTPNSRCSQSPRRAMMHSKPLFPGRPVRIATLLSFNSAAQYGRKTRCSRTLSLPRLAADSFLSHPQTNQHQIIGSTANSRRWDGFNLEADWVLGVGVFPDRITVWITARIAARISRRLPASTIKLTPQLSTSPGGSPMVERFVTGH